MKMFALLASLALVPQFAEAKAQTFKIDTQKSKVEWIGKKVTGSHNGHLKIKSGNVLVENGKITGGEIEVDMRSLVVEDIKDQETNAKLLNHLKSDDFFSVDKFPVATFKITGSEKDKDGKQKLTGNLTIKGIPHPESGTLTEVKIDQNKLSGKSTFNVDRTKWNIRYRSGKFFPDLGDKIIYDEFTIAPVIEARK